MPAPPSVDAFCRLMMVDLEEQWAGARGHQERHPLREKMRQLSLIVEQVEGGEQLEDVLRRGIEGDDAVRALLCSEMQQRWQLSQERAGG